MSLAPALTHVTRLKIMGSDGKEYLYLLKAHEDLRQVMPFYCRVLIYTVLG